MTIATHVSTSALGLLLLLTGTISAVAQERGMLTTDSLPLRWQSAPPPEYVQAMDADTPWWHSFGDATLDTLLQIGMDNNYNVLIAARRVEIARQTLNQVRSQYYPTLTLSAGWSGARQSGAISSKETPAQQTTYFQAGVDMSWQVDLFGRITQKARQQKSLVDVSRATLAATRVSMAAEIASTYIRLRVLQAQGVVANEHLRSQKSVLDITEARTEAGLGSMLDVSQAKTVYYSTEASLPQLNTSITQAINSLAVLLGVLPEELPRSVYTLTKLPGYDHIVGIGVPMELLRRRPDIAEAEAQIAADAAAVGVAKKEWLPMLSINGSVGISAHKPGWLGQKNSVTWAIAPTLSWTIFDGLSRNYAIQSAREQLQADIDNYNLTVLNAVSEVNSAIAAYTNALQQIDLYQQVADEAGTSVKLSVDLYRSGLNPFTDVTQSLISYLTYSNSLVTARGNALSALVTLYKALGGGWEAE